MQVRTAAAQDLPAIQSIYAHHVLHGLASFEEVPPPLEEMRRRFEDITKQGFPYLVAEEKGEILGYGYCSLYRTRSAYRHTLEDSIYVKQGQQGKGVGKAVLTELIARLHGAQLPPDHRRDRRQRQCGLDQAARQPRLRARGPAALHGLQVRPLGRQRVHAAAAGRRGRSTKP